MSRRSLRTLLRVAPLTVAVLLLAAAGSETHAQSRSAVHVTPSGYRVPVFGMSVARGDDGRLEVVCRRLDAPEVDSGLLSHTVSRAMMARSLQVQVQEENGLTFTVIYTDPPGTGFLDAEHGEARQAALEATFAAWSAVLKGSVPVVVQVRMEEMDEDSEVLAHAGPVDFVELDGVAVPYSLAAQRRGEPVNNGGADIEVVFNSRMPWDYALDGVAQDEERVSFIYTALHEIGHGLGFMDTFDPEEGTLLNPVPTPYDTFINRGHGEQRVRDRSPAQIREDLVSGDLFFAGSASIEASRGSIVPLPMIKLYAPDPYEQGSSVSHVDQETYSDVEVGLMTPGSFGLGAKTVDVLTLGILADLGYELVSRPAEPTERR